MKKIILLAIMACCSLLGKAQSKNGAIILKSPVDYQVTSISENGLWACGTYMDDSSVDYGFRWNLTSGKVETLEANSVIYGVANDGTIVGSFVTNEITGSNIEVAGMWNGKWTMLELPNKVGCWASAISPDGKYISGTDNNYVSYIWKDGKLLHTAQVQGIVEEANGTFMSYCISPDGTKIGGWAYYSDDNRNPGYWDSTDKKFHELNADQPGSPWQAVRKFSPNGKHLLFWGGYHQDSAHPELGYGIKAIYDMSKKSSQIIYPIWQDPFNFDLFDMGGNGSVVGVIQDDEGMEKGFIYADGKSQFIESYLTNKGVSFANQSMYQNEDGTHYIIRATAISSDEKKIAILYYDTAGELHSAIVILDQDLTMTPPVCLESKQLAGLAVAQLEWNEPLGDKTNLKGYNVYRNGDKVNSALITTTSYLDKELPVGTYTYAVTAMYAEGESAKSESSILTIDQNVINKQPQQPVNLFARQKGYKSAFAMWDGPKTNYIEQNYYGNGDTYMDGFGGGEVSFESGTLFPADMVSLYKGHRIVGVSFYPLTDQEKWVINLYRHVGNELTLLKSIPVKQELTFGEKNTVMLSSPLTIQDGQDLLVGIQTNVSVSSYAVQGVYEGCLKVGYTDLLRTLEEGAEFFSVNEASEGAEYDMAWATSVLLAPADATGNLDAIDHYNVYVDGTKKGETKEMSYEDNTLTDGNHTLGIQTAYSDGRLSEKAEVKLAIKANQTALQIDPVVKCMGANLTTGWLAPRDLDVSALGYCNDIAGLKHPNATADVTEIVARVDYYEGELRSYEGYQINSLSFVPMSNSSYELNVYEDGVPLAAVEVDNFTVGAWNTVTLPKPITIKKGKYYSYYVVCYDCPADQPPLAIDNKSMWCSYSALIQSGGEEGWYYISDETSCDGNWMMRMNVSNPKGALLNATGYDVYIDSEKKSSKQTGTTYLQNFGSAEDKNHTLRVDAYYANLTNPVEGITKQFNLANATVIEGVEIEPSKTIKNATFNMAGQKVNDRYKGIVIKNGKAVLNR